MKLLEERIRLAGKVKDGDILKVDSFLNHQLDIELLDKLGEEFYRLFKDSGVNKILTVEASGIAFACMAARYFKVPVVFAKKSRSANISEDVYKSEVRSFTHGVTNTVIVSREYLSPKDRVLIIDDFLANGKALTGLTDIVRQSGAVAVGAGIVIEKAYQGGGDRLRANGLRIESLAKIVSMSDEDGIIFDSDI